MLRTNSKKARENLRKFIVENTDYEGYGYDDDFEKSRNLASNFKGNDWFSPYKFFLIKTFYEEKEQRDKRNMRRFELFREWAQGLAGCGLFDYYCYREKYNPVDLLGDILEETEEERKRFSEDEAAEKLTQLIFNELYKGVY